MTLESVAEFAAPMLRKKVTALDGERAAQRRAKLVAKEELYGSIVDSLLSTPCF